MRGYTTFSAVDIAALEPTIKIGLLGTVDGVGRPHLTLLSSLRASRPDQMVFGQFTEGLSKCYVHDNPRTGFLAMSLDRNLWRGKATFTHTAQDGPEFEWYNDTPMFRYNAYFGVHTVYYFDLVEQSGRAPLPMGRVVAAALRTMAAKAMGGQRYGAEVLNPWIRGLMNKLGNLKFLAYVGEDGYPVIVPAIQALTVGSDRVLFALGPYAEDLTVIPEGATVAVFGMTLQMEDVLLRGRFEGIRRVGGIRCGSVAVDWVYSPMPPKATQVYPPVPLERVTSF
jgi:hypothetical protein